MANYGQINTLQEAQEELANVRTWLSENMPGEVAPDEVNIELEEVDHWLNNKGDKGEQGDVGPSGADGADAASSEEELSYSWGDAPQKIYTTGVAKMIYGVRVIVDTAFNGINPSLTIGDLIDTDRLFSADMIDLTIPGTYESYPAHTYADTTDIYANITPGEGASQGSGKIVIYHQK